MKQQKVLVEQTSKRLKVIRAVGILLVLVAIPVALVMADKHGPTNIGYALAGLVGGAGIITWIVGSIITWWQHG